MLFEVNGAQAFAATGGRDLVKGQPAIVFIHGAGMDHSVWALQTRYFAHRGRNVLALDLPGHGKSEGDALTSIEAMGDWIVSAMTALGIDQAAMVGHSMGSLIALDLAARLPEKVSAIGLVGTAADMPVNQALLDAAAEDKQEAIDMVTGWGFGPPGQFGGHRGPGLWMLGGGQRLMQNTIAASSGVLYHDLKACNDFAGGMDKAASVSQPAFLVLGSEDKMTPARAGQKLAKAMAAVPGGAKVTTLDGIGHMVMIEAPDDTLDAMIDGLAA
ncbi:MAG: alpha/beta hydrolase [Pseudomonadota bacterium]